MKTWRSGRVSPSLCGSGAEPSLLLGPAESAGKESVAGFLLCAKQGGKRRKGGERDLRAVTVTKGIPGSSILREAADFHWAWPSHTGADADPSATAFWGWASGS